ncbi:MAG: hypothetical protein ONB44_11235 [candidate division KSB1 bacterium]|nr:hypothetical protein [candidate division KSB1 bacterium]MDZ7302696.1 hypothetical protein [candidate division KSB1 bacterium]MDZ7311773.1 hypothetical protein [candidate division KSB1 bacterium]
MADEERRRRTVHGWQRHREGTRPTAFAFQDRDYPEEVYEQNDGRMVYVGKNGRTHIFDGDRHHTSFYSRKNGRQRKVKSGRWRRIK